MIHHSDSLHPHKDIDLIAVGYPSLDRIIKIDSAPRIGYTSLIVDRSDEKIHYGGCNVNIAYTAKKLGLNAMPAMRVGGDFDTCGLRQFLDDAGVPLTAITVIPEESTSRSYLLEDQNGHHMTLFYPGAMSAKYVSEVPERLIRRTRYGVITVGDPRTNIQFARSCVENKVPLVFGMKCDANAFSKDDLQFMLTSSSILFMNEHEMHVIIQLLGLQDIRTLFTVGRTDCIVITKGKQGSEVIFIADADNKEITTCRVGIIPEERKVDTTGVGDAYIAGFMVGILRGKTYEQAAVIGSAVSSFIIESDGCLESIPTIDQIRARIRNTLQEEIL